MFFFTENDQDNYGQVIDNEGIKVTNQTMELLACVQALKIIKTKIANGLNIKIIYIYTDSTYLINSVTKWYMKWEKNGWKNSKGNDVENKELIQLLINIKSDFIIIFKHIKSHQNEPSNKKTPEYLHWYGNFMADKLATNACKNYINEKQTQEPIKEQTQKQTQEQKQKQKQKMKNILNV